MIKWNNNNDRKDKCTNEERRAIERHHRARQRQRERMEAAGYDYDEDHEERKQKPKPKNEVTIEESDD